MREVLRVPVIRMLTITVIAEPAGEVALIRADFVAHPPDIVKVRARGARTVVRGGSA